MADELKCVRCNRTQCSGGLSKHLGRITPHFLKVSAPPQRDSLGAGGCWASVWEALPSSPQGRSLPRPLLCQWDVPSAGCVWGQLWAPALSVCGF